MRGGPFFPAQPDPCYSATASGRALGSARLSILPQTWGVLPAIASSRSWEFFYSLVRLHVEAPDLNTASTLRLTECVEESSLARVQSVIVLFDTAEAFDQFFLPRMVEKVAHPFLEFLRAFASGHDVRDSDSLVRLR